LISIIKLDINSNPKLSSNEIPQFSGQIQKDIRQSYTGGAVDMYIPRIKKGVKF
jgi:hypothetical protein